MPRPEVGPVRGYQRVLCVAGLELKGGEREIDEPHRARRHEGAAIHLVREGEKENEKSAEDDTDGIQWIHRVLSRSLTRTPRLRPPGWLGVPPRLAFLISPHDEHHQAQPVEPTA